MDSYNDDFAGEEVGAFGEYTTTTSLYNIPSFPPVTQYKGYKIVSKEIASEPNEGEFIAPDFDEGATFGEYATTTKVNGEDSMFTPSIDPQPLYNNTFVETTPIFESEYTSQSIPAFETSSSLQNIENSTYQTNFDFSAPNQEIELDFPITSSPIIETDNLQSIPDYTSILDTENLQSFPDYSPIIETKKLKSIPDYTPIFGTENIQSIPVPIIETENLQTISSPIIETENLQTFANPIIETSNLQTFANPIIETSNLQTFTSPIIETSNLQTIQSPTYETSNLQTITSPSIETTNLQTIPGSIIETSNLQTIPSTILETTNLQTIQTPIIETSNLQTVPTPIIETTNLQTIPGPIVETTNIQTIPGPIVETTNIQTIPKVNVSTYQTTSPAMNIGINYENPSTIKSPAIDTYPVTNISNTTIQPMKMSTPKYSIVESPIVTSSIVPSTKAIPTINNILPPKQSKVSTNSLPISFSILPPVQSTIVTKALPFTHSISPLAQTTILTKKLPKTHISYVPNPLYKPSSVVQRPKPVYTNAPLIPIQPSISLVTYTPKPIYTTLPPVNIISQPIYSTLSSTTAKSGPLYSTYSSPIVRVKSNPSYSELTVPFIPVHHRPIYSHKRRSSSAQLKPVYNFSTLNVPLQHKPLYSSLSTIPITQPQIPIYSTFSTYTVPKHHKHSYSSLSLPTASSKPLYSSFTVNSSMPAQTLSLLPMTSVNYPLGTFQQLSVSPYVNTSTIGPLIGMNRQPIYNNFTYSTKKSHLPMYNSIIAPKPNMIKPGQYNSRTYTARRL